MVDVPVGVVVVQIIGLECGTPTHPPKSRGEAGRHACDGGWGAPLPGPVSSQQTKQGRAVAQAPVLAPRRLEGGPLMPMAASTLLTCTLTHVTCVYATCARALQALVEKALASAHDIKANDVAMLADESDTSPLVKLYYDEPQHVCTYVREQRGAGDRLYMKIAVLWAHVCMHVPMSR